MKYGYHFKVIWWAIKV